MAKKKKRSARSYKLGAQKAAASRAKNKLKKELVLVNLKPSKEKIMYEGEMQSKTTVQNKIVAKITRINTDYIEPLNKKLRTKATKSREAQKQAKIEAFKDREGAYTFENFKVWEKGDFEQEILQDSAITKVNGKKISKDLDKIKGEIDALFDEMGSKAIAYYVFDENTGEVIIGQREETQDEKAERIERYKENRNK